MKHFSPIQFVLTVQDAADQRIAIVASILPLRKARRLAQDLLRLKSNGHHVNIYPFAGIGEEAKRKYEGDPLEQIAREEPQ